MSDTLFGTIGAVQAVVVDWCYGFYDRGQCRFALGMMSPIICETTAFNRDAT